jgi:polygalacturonase
VSNSGILGEGLASIISGPMWQMIDYYDPAAFEFQPVMWTGVNGCQGECRPRGVVFVDSVNITVSNFWLRDSADWSSLYRRCSNVWVDRLRISGSLLWPNNDGIDLESGSNITLSNLDISVGDDGIVFASGNTNNMNHPWPEPVPYSALQVLTHVCGCRVGVRACMSMCPCMCVCL